MSGAEGTSTAAATANGAASQLMRLLREHKISEFPLRREPVIINASETPQKAHEILMEANIQSAPVWDESEKKYIGMIDMRDLVAAVVWAHREPDRKVEAGYAEPTSEFVARMLRASAQMRGLPHQGFSLLSLVRRNNFHCVNRNASLEEATTLLLKKGCHRVPVVDDSGKIVNIMSQSTIIKFLNDHMDELDDFGKITIAEAACGTSPVLSVNSNDTVLDAFRVIAENDITGVAVVDAETGNLVANTSAVDFREFLRDPSTSLDSKVATFMEKVRQHGLTSRHPAMSINSADTFADVVAKLVRSKAHRLYVVDLWQPRAVISLTDILRYAYNRASCEGGGQK
eukprot:m.28550 g.28550  ORF g.28550 m.28550 type:complete len:343 (+) comp4527_c0_seq1:59-1087(+)